LAAKSEAIERTGQREREKEKERERERERERLVLTVILSGVCR